MASSIPLYCCRCMPFSNVLSIIFTKVFVTDIVSRARMSHLITLAAPSPDRKHSMPAAPVPFLPLIRGRRYVAAYMLAWEPLLVNSLYVMAHFSISSYFIFISCLVTIVEDVVSISLIERTQKPCPGHLGFRCPGVLIVRYY